ncbi:DsrE family protein [Flavobacteriaceae bacterium]|jgi:intracellular sulfur oxidation DsrE/DsrF family protein|nr:DsrE family protein [Flavobacteriaceae bacterium]MDA9878688.1 DsrE family protein [Flavobacteriaceae bacterium]MDB2328268.1 DsrE family protein [Flavobacteriaceae bacterium]
MKRSIQTASIFISLFTFLCVSHLQGQEWQTPLIDGYGEIKYFEDTAQQPDPTKEYKLIFDITSDQLKSGVNKRLWVIARTMNMLTVANVPQPNIKIVAAIHGAATFTVLTDEAYQKKYGSPNPNLEIIEKLKENGVQLYVCSQAISARGINFEDINVNVIPALSALSVLSNYQMNGYSLMP